MTVLIPRPAKDKITPVLCVGKSLLQKYKQRDTSELIMLTSKDAEWDKELKSYVLNYRGRASQVRAIYDLTIFRARLRPSIHVTGDPPPQFCAIELHFIGASIERLG